MLAGYFYSYDEVIFIISDKQLNLSYIDSDIDAYQPLEVYKKILTKNKIAFVRNKIFLKVQYSGKTLPDFGWKIHVSAVPSNAEMILDQVSAYCHANRITFKVMLDPVVLARNLSKSGKRSSSGKFITIYPLSEEDFVFTIRDLGEMLKIYNGPYVLSDKRYEDCKVLYYRYGRMNVKEKRYINNKWCHVIEGPNKELFIDEPIPRYTQPSWITDPLEKYNDKTAINEKFCNGKYTILGVKHMSNSGGVYVAKEENTQEIVVLKEARPSLAILKNGVDAIKLRKNEMEILKVLADCPAVPRLRDQFYEWEHFFISVDYIEGKTFHQIVTDPIFIDNKFSNPHLNLKLGISIFIEILKSLHSVHQCDITIGDISGYNVMITPTGQVKFIDFESATNKEMAFDASYFMETQGFRYHKLKKDLSNRFEVDIEGVGLLFLSFFYNTGSFYSIAPGNIRRILDGLLKDSVITKEIFEILKEMIFSAHHFQYDLTMEKLTNKRDMLLEKRTKTHNSYKTPLLKNKVGVTLQKAYESMLNNACLDSSERVFRFVNQEKKLSLWRGSLGVLLTIEKLEKVLSLSSSRTDEISDKLNRFMDQSDIVNPSFFDGKAGIALGTHISQRLQKQPIDKTLITNVKEINLYEGICGIGLAYLHIYRLNKADNDLLRQASLIGEEVVERINNLNEKQFSVQELGFYNGLSGVSYFLLELYEDTKNQIFFDKAYQVLEHCINSTVSINDSLYVPFSPKTPKYHTGFLGNGGVALALAKLISLQPSQDHYDLLQSLMKPMYNPYITGISYGNGLAGNLKILLALKRYNFVSLEEESLGQLVGNLLRFTFVYQKQTYFPDGNLNMIDLTYYNGMCGIIDALIDYYCYCEMSV